jgi:AraC-like DNA-binding protein
MRSESQQLKPGGRHRTARSSRSDGPVRVGILVGLPAVLRSLGADPADLVTEAGFDPDVFDDPNNVISCAARGRLFSQCVALTGCKHFGLLLGEGGRLSWLGLVGFLVQHSPDVEAALRSLVRYTHPDVCGGVASFAVHGNSAMVSFDVVLPHLEATDQTGDAAMAMLLNIMRTLCGPEWKPIEVRFSHRKPEDAGPFRRLFRAPLHFDAEQNAIVFSTDWLRRPLPGHDPELRRLLQERVNALDARHQEDFPEQVRSVLRRALLTGHANADQIAALFSMHSRTLRRRLDECGVSFKQLVDEARYTIAQQMLADSARDVSEIAALLNYADASAFTRAFRRWSGTTPGAWRAKRKAAALRKN